MKHIAPAAFAFALLTLATSQYARAQALTLDEIACTKGGSEACFYAGADYASGNGVEMNKAKGAELFLKACDLGVPDGCYYTATMYRHGAEGISADPARGISLYEKACTMGHEEACSATYSVLGSDEKGERDIPRLLRALEKGCANESLKACKWGGDFFYDGNRGKYPEFVDFVRGAPLAEKACLAGDPIACIAAEVMYAQPDSPAFDAAKALTFMTKNCNANIKESCGNLGRTYAIVEDFDFAVGPYEKSCALGNESVCDYAKDLRRYVDELAAWNAKQAARRSEMASMLNAGDYNGAVATAVSVYSSTVYADQAVSAAASAGRMGDIDDYDLMVLEHWFQTGQTGSLVRSEMRRRGLAVSGEDNSWARDMQMIKSANERFNAARSTSSYRPIEQGPAAANSGPTDAIAKTREKYRDAHCTMNNNANRYLCQ